MCYHLLPIFVPFVPFVHAKVGCQNKQRWGFMISSTKRPGGPQARTKFWGMDQYSNP